MLVSLRRSARWDLPHPRPKWRSSDVGLQSTRAEQCKLVVRWDGCRQATWKITGPNTSSKLVTSLLEPVSLHFGGLLGYFPLLCNDWFAKWCIYYSSGLGFPLQLHEVPGGFQSCCVLGVREAQNAHLWSRPPFVGKANAAKPSLQALTFPVSRSHVLLAEKGPVEAAQPRTMFDNRRDGSTEVRATACGCTEG